MDDGITTVQITDAQTDALAGMKRSDREAVKTVLGRLLAGHPAAEYDIAADEGLFESVDESDAIPVGGGGDEIPPGIQSVMDADAEDLEDIREELQALRESVDSAPERTADELEGRFR